MKRYEDRSAWYGDRMIDNMRTGNMRTVEREDKPSMGEDRQGIDSRHFTYCIVLY